MHIYGTVLAVALILSYSYMVRVWNIYIIIHRRHQFSEATAGKQRTPGFVMKMGLIKLPTHDPYSTSHEEDHSMHVCVCLVT